MSLKAFPLGLIFSAANLRLSLVACAVTALVSACGGGGGGSASNTPAPSGLEVTTYVALQAAAPTPVYSGIGAQARTDVFNYINNTRQTCGFGLVRQNLLLDQAAQNHGNYMIGQKLLGDPHNESVGQPGFTGVTGSDRATAVGYKFNGHEVLENGDLPTVQTNVGIVGAAAPLSDDVIRDSFRGLMSAPYHSLPAMFGPATDLGIGLGYNSTTAIQNVTFLGNIVSENLQTDLYGIYYEYGMGMNGAGQASSSGVQTYPCTGIVDAYPATFAEVLPYGGSLTSDGRVLGANPTSSPIYVVGEPNKTLVINSAVVTQVDTGQVLKVYDIRTKSTDSANFIYWRNDWSGFVWLDKPYAPGKSYSTVIHGTSGGTAFTHSFTFTAGKYTALDEAGAASLGLPI